jgi:hypothetical protein
MPVWLQMHVNVSPDMHKFSLCDLPLTRLSETWYGPNTQAGQLYYACPTRAHLAPVDQSPRLDVVEVIIDIHNISQDTLVVDRMFIPASHMTIFRSGSGNLVTEQLRMESAGGGKFGDVQLVDPLARSDMKVLTLPREKSPHRTFIDRAMVTLFASRV